MLTVLTGDNIFALEAELANLTAAYLKEQDDLGLERLDGQAGAEAVRGALTSAPFLAERKLVILREPGASKEIQDQAEQLFGDIAGTTDVIIVEPKFDKRSNYYKYLKKHADFHEFPQLDPAGLARWLVETAKEQGGSLGSADARYLVERVGTDQELLSHELEKLLLYDPRLTKQNIDLLTDPAPQSTVFQLLEAAFAGDRRRALRLYSEQRAQNVEPPQIIAMLAWQLNVLAVIKTAGDRTPDEIAKQSRLNPYVVRKSLGIARRLSLASLKRLINDLLRIDMGIKRTGMNADEALQHYLLGLHNIS